jgi:hypothetical protein
MGIDLSNIINVFISPTEAFQHIKKTSKWLIAFVIICTVGIIIGFLLNPFVQKVMEQSLLAQMDDDQVQQTLSIMSKVHDFWILIGSISIIIKWLVFSVFLYFGAILFDAEQINFKNIYAIVVHSELIILLMGLINVLILLIKGVDAVSNITDLQTIIGLDYFLYDKSHNVLLFNILNGFNIFSVWYIATLTIGMFVVSQLNKWKSAVLVSSVWLIGIGFQFGFGLIAENIQHMMGK